MELQIVMKADLLAIKSAIEDCLKKRTIHGSKNWRTNQILKGYLRLIDDNIEGERLDFDNVDTLKIGNFDFKKITTKETQ